MGGEFIGNFAFYGCSEISEVWIGKAVFSIGSSAFAGCAGLTSVNLASSNITRIGAYAFADCAKLTQIDIPISVTSIGKYAFLNCNSLESITVPSSVTWIGDYAFEECLNLTIYCEISSQPDGWDAEWNSTGCPVCWGAGEEDDESTGGEQGGSFIGQGGFNIG